MAQGPAGQECVKRGGLAHRDFVFQSLALPVPTAFPEVQPPAFTASCRDRDLDTSPGVLQVLGKEECP